MPALVAMPFNPNLKAKYTQFHDAGKTGQGCDGPHHAQDNAATIKQQTVKVLLIQYLELNIINLLSIRYKGEV